MQDNTFYIEVSFEVANKVGGIYTVLKSKAAEMSKIYKDNYIVIGPYDTKKSESEFVVEDSKNFKPVFEKLAKEGITCFYGRWRTKPNPRCILVDITNYRNRKNEIKKWLWDNFKIDSLKAGDDFDYPVIWSYCVGILIENLKEKIETDNVVAHFHEWLSGTGMLYLNKKNAKVGTIFTTHATIAGRTMAGNGENIHEIIEEALKKKAVLDDRKPYEYGIEAKHQLEKACANNADVFTAVSKTTADEAQFILGRYPDVLLLNGLEMDNFPSMEELSYFHKLQKMDIMKFVDSYFEPYYNINHNDPRIIFISGRYEFHNKGIDVFISALGKLNEELKKENFEKDTIVFIFVPSDIVGETYEVLENKISYDELSHFVEEYSKTLKDKVVNHLAMGGNLEKKLSQFMEKEEYLEVKKLVENFKSRKGQNAPLSAFKLNYDEEKDSIIRALKENGLLNREQDKIKVIFYPTYVSATDRLLSMNYNNIVLGCSAGIFPSYYEPWGYTPLEAAARGVVTMTTDCSGFGQFVMEKTGDRSDIYILKVKNREYDKIVNDLKGIISQIVKMDKHDIVEKKRSARLLANLAGWEKLIENYVNACKLAVSKYKKRTS